MVSTVSEKTIQKTSTTTNVAPEVYGICKHCHNRHQLKPNPHEGEPSFEASVLTFGDRARYVVVLHRRIENGIEKGNCKGSGRFPTEIHTEQGETR